MSTCLACTEARANAWSGAYRSDCLECSARALSHSPMRFETVKAGKMLPEYEAALRVEFGDDWAAWIPRVKAWASRRKA